MAQAYVGGEVHTGTGEVFPEGTVLVQDGRILAVGPADRVTFPAGWEVVEAHGRVVTPGLIDAHTHAGIWEEGVGEEGDDVNETTDPVTPHLRVIDGINPADRAFADALTAGITTVFCTQGSANVLGGEGATLRTWGRTVEEMVLKAPAGLKAALGENPKRIYGREKKRPATRPGIAAIMRESLVAGQNYLAKREKNAVERDLKMESIGRVLRGEIPLRLHAHRADDICTGLRIAEEFSLRLCLEHCTEGHLVAAELAARKIPAVVGPGLTARVKVELRGKDLATAGILHRAGVKVAITTDHPVLPLEFLRLLAALTAGEGLEEEAALCAITGHAAEICGVGDRVGTLEPGKEADLVVWDQHPFRPAAKAALVLVAGRPVAGSRAVGMPPGGKAGSPIGGRKPDGETFR